MDRRVDPLSNGMLSCADVQFEQLHIIQQHTEWLQNLVERLIFTDEELSDDDSDDSDDENDIEAEESLIPNERDTSNVNATPKRKRKSRRSYSSSSSSSESSTINSRSSSAKKVSRGSDNDESTAITGRNTDA